MTINIMKPLLLALLLSGSYANVALAGGDHEGGHEKKEKAGHGAKPDHHAMKEEAHGDHEHDSGGSSVGQPADAAKATKTIEVTTLDTMRYEFSSTPDLQGGDIVKFVVTNKGKISHEFSIGDAAEQKSHQAMMRNMPNMVHQDGNTVTIKPGETKQLTWQFKGGSEAVFACNIPGHFEAGMFLNSPVSEAGEHHSKAEAHSH